MTSSEYPWCADIRQYLLHQHRMELYEKNNGRIFLLCQRIGMKAWVFWSQKDNSSAQSYCLKREKQNLQGLLRRLKLHISNLFCHLHNCYQIFSANSLIYARENKLISIKHLFYTALPVHVANMFNLYILFIITCF